MATAWGSVFAGSGCVRGARYFLFQNHAVREIGACGRAQDFQAGAAIGGAGEVGDEEGAREGGRAFVDLQIAAEHGPEAF
jgi:hypothetical protein